LLSQEAFRATPLGSVVLRNAAFTVKFLNRDIEACFELERPIRTVPRGYSAGKGIAYQFSITHADVPAFSKVCLRASTVENSSPEALELNLKV